MPSILKRGAAVAAWDRTGLSLCVLATAIVTLPVWFARFAPLHDFPFHVARMFILNDLMHGGAFTRFYEVNSFFLPNVGMDLVILALGQVISVEMACRIFIVLMIFLMISGANFLHRTMFQTSGLAVPIAALLAYNSIFTLGFVNYLMGIGLVLWGVGIFIRVQSYSLAARLALGLLIGLVLVFTHLAAFGVYAIIVAGLELQEALPMLRTAPSVAVTRLIWSAMPLVVIIGLFFLVSPTAGASTDWAAAGHVDFSMASVVSYLRSKPWMLRRFLEGVEDPTLDQVSIVLAVVIVATLFAVTKVRIARQAALALALLCLAFVLAPSETFSAMYLNMRLPIAIAFVAAGCVYFATGTSRTQVLLVVALLGIVALRSAVVTRDWIGYDAVERQFIDAYACLSRGSVLFVARPPIIGLWSGYWRPPIKHIASLATATDGVFVPQTWADPAQQPIRVRRDFDDVYTFQSPNPIAIADVAALHAAIRDIRALMQHHGAGPVYLMLLEPGPLDHPSVNEAPRIVDSDLFSIYQLDPGAAGTPPARACPADASRR